MCAVLWGYQWHTIGQCVFTSVVGNSSERAECSTSALQKAWALVALFSSSFFLFFPLPLFAALWPRSSGPCTFCTLSHCFDSRQWTTTRTTVVDEHVNQMKLLLLKLVQLRFCCCLSICLPVCSSGSLLGCFHYHQCQCHSPLDLTQVCQSLSVSVQIHTHTLKESEAHVTADSAAAALANLSTVVCVCPAIHIVSHAYQFLAFIHSMTEWMCVYVSPCCLYLPV